MLKGLTFQSPNVRKRHVLEQSTKVRKVSSHKMNYEHQRSLDRRTKAASQQIYKGVLETKVTTDKREMKL